MIESNGGKVTYISISTTIGSFVWEIQEGARLYSQFLYGTIYGSLSETVYILLQFNMLT